jgi:PEP-CTERM motif
MKIKLASILALGALAMFASTARATSIRAGSNYGILGTIESANSPMTIPGVGTEWVVCATDTMDAAPDCLDKNFDLILQTDGATGPLNITVPGLSSTSFSSTSAAFGLIACDDRFPDVGLQNVCTPVSGITAQETTCGAELATTIPVGTTVTLPADCMSLPNATFYFDETSASFSPSTATPEPSSLLLLMMGLVPLGYAARRRQRV